MLCCTYCSIQYIDSARAPADMHEQELQAWENRVHFFTGEDEP